MKVAILIDWYEPAYLAGGPIRSIKNLAHLLKDDYEISIVAGVTDLRFHPAMKDVSDGMISERYEGSIHYLERGWRFAQKLRNLLFQIQPDVLYINGIYSRYFSLLPMVLASMGLLTFGKLVVSPRGMLSAGALGVKTFQKRIALGFLKNVVINHNWYWHATDDQEKLDISNKLDIPSDRITIAGNVPQKPIKGIAYIDLTSPLKLVLISRLSPEKNIDGVIRELARIDGPVHLNIFGEFQRTSYQRKVRNELEALPENVVVSFIGSIPPDEVEDKILEAHFFIHLTHGENFGHSIFEALAVGRPVIISRHTPWTETVAEGAGYLWDEESSLQDIIQMISQLSQSDYEEQCVKAHESAWAYYRKVTTDSKYHELFNLN